MEAATPRHAPRRLASLAAALIAMPGITPASPAAMPVQYTRESTTPVTWADCPANEVGFPPPELGQRLQCAILDMPLDHRHPDTRRMPVNVIRITAMDASRREGAIFFNIGGPGGHPGEYLALLAAAWTTVDPDDAIHGDKRKLAERFDLVAVVPRGLGSAWHFDCLRDIQPTRAFLPSNRDDANWRRTMVDARREARSCASVPEAAYINTEQHVHDMDAVRAVLGDETLHFYGISHGALVGAWYASLFPTHMGRMLLDSPFYFPGGYRDAIYLTLEAQRRHFEETILRPVSKAPAHYGLTLAGNALMPSLYAFPAVLREAWHDRLESPWHLAAAITLQQYVARTGWHGWPSLWSRLDTIRFHAAHDSDAMLRIAAMELIDHGRHGSIGRHPYADTPGESVGLTTICGDAPWWGTEAQLRARVDRDASSFWLSSGSITFRHLTCTLWTPRRAVLPEFPPSLSFLAVQSDGDVRTPLRGAEALLTRYPQGHLIVATGSNAHGLFSNTDTGCVERGATRYLLDGSFPSASTRTTRCAAVAFPDDGNDDGLFFRLRRAMALPSSGG